jgi:hypothetical protein
MYTYHTGETKISSWGGQMKVFKMENMKEATVET